MPTMQTLSLRFTLKTKKTITFLLLFQAIHLDHIRDFQFKCLYYFTYLKTIENPDFFLFEIIPKGLINDIYSIVSNCLRLDIKTIVNNNSLVGLNTFDVKVYDKFLRSDSITCNIYFTRSCLQRYLVLVSLNFIQVNLNLGNYKWYFN
jgi:hypothetical protein